MLCFVCLFHINLYRVLIAIRILFYFSFLSRFIFSYVVFNLYSCHVVIMLCFNYSPIFIYFVIYLFYCILFYFWFSCWWAQDPSFWEPFYSQFFRFFLQARGPIQLSQIQTTSFGPHSVQSRPSQQGQAQVSEASSSLLSACRTSEAQQTFCQLPRAR